jgi:Dyp-type peroxidase family
MMASMKLQTLELDDIQGDILIGLQKVAENFIFFKLASAPAFKILSKSYLLERITSSREGQQRELIIRYGKRLGGQTGAPFHGVGLALTKDGLTQLLGADRQKLCPAFERGADHPDTIATLNDPPKLSWLREFVSDRIDGVFLVTGRDRSAVALHSNELLALLRRSIKVVYSEIGTTRPGAERGHEHFGFLDGISNPGIRGLTPASNRMYKSNEGLPGQDLIWPGEFVFGHPGQHPDDPVKAGPEPRLAAPWMRNGSYMVFRRLEQKVPEFRRFVRESAARLGMDPELLAARMVGRWKSGAPVELTPLRDDSPLGADERRNNDFGFGDDRFQRKCPFAAHIRKVYPRDDVALAEAQRHRIIRRGIPFGPEVAPGETTTRHSRGLMFVCYQTSIERQLEYIQRRYANNPEFVDGKERPGGGGLVEPGFDPIIGQAPGNGPRWMDEPYPNYSAGNRRTALEMPSQFVVLTAAAYFFMPSISALRTMLT